MEGFGLLIGHLLGDYILQNDWMASFKTAPASALTEQEGQHAMSLIDDARMEYLTSRWFAYRPMIACTVHCLLYTMAVWTCSFWWMPWWGVVACFILHWPVDRFRLATLWMTNVSGQTAFARGPLAPWSIIVVDNTFHLVVLFVIGVLA